MADEQEQLTAEELVKQLKVSDLLLGTLASLVQLGYAKLGEGDAGQARLAIEAVRALTPVLESAVSAEALRDVRQATANLQLAYAEKLRATPDQETQEET